MDKHSKWLRERGSNFPAFVRRCGEAADEIDRLEAENERLKDALNLANIDALNNEAEANYLQAENKRLREDRDLAYKQSCDDHVRAKEAEAERDQWQEAAGEQLVLRLKKELAALRGKLNATEKALRNTLVGCACQKSLEFGHCDCRCNETRAVLTEHFSDD